MFLKIKIEYCSCWNSFFNSCELAKSTLKAAYPTSEIREFKMPGNTRVFKIYIYKDGKPIKIFDKSNTNYKLFMHTTGDFL